MTYYDENGVHQPPQETPKRRTDVAFFGLVGSLVLAAGLLGSYLFFIRGGEDSESRAHGSAAVVPPPSSTTTSNPLEHKQLKGLANAIALHLHRGNTEVASSIIVNARAITNCVITAYTGGANEADLAVKKNRDFVAADAAEKGIPIAFGHKRDTWIVVAQVCE